jgi:serine/threonine protein phosphatase PrpC
VSIAKDSDAELPSGSAPPSGQAMACRACQATVGAGDRFCESCGQALGPAVSGGGPARPELASPRPQAGPPAPGIVTKIPCASCGTGEISPDGYCALCGHRQPAGRDHLELDSGVAAGVSDRGRRPQHNEDAMVTATAGLPDGRTAVLAVVCDGVSSTPRAADASQAAAQAGAAALARAIGSGRDPADASRAAVARAAQAVTSLAAEPAAGAQPDGSVLGDGGEAPSTTYVSAVVMQTSVIVASVGDSRAYWLAAPQAPGERARASASARLTEDDSWAALKIASGELTEAAAYADPRAHTIVGWLGADAGEVQAHVTAFTPDGPGAVLVCSDGLWNYLPGPAELAAAVPGAAGVPLQAARDLVRIALNAGGHDNITAVLIPFPAE